MSVTVRMPQLGETVMEGTILRWAKEPGDAISEEEVLLEVSTDKVDTEVPSPAAGVVLEILVPAGETVPVGTALAVIGEAGELPAAAAQQAAVAVPSPPAALPVAPPQEAFRPASAEFAPPPIRRDGERTPADLGFLSPVVRRLASDHDLDLREVAGTGREGRVTRKDVQAFIDARAQAAPETPVSEVPVPAVVMPEAAPAGPPCRSWRSSPPSRWASLPPSRCRRRLHRPLPRRYPKQPPSPPGRRPSEARGARAGHRRLDPHRRDPDGRQAGDRAGGCPGGRAGRRRPGRRRPGRTGTQAADDGPAAAQRSGGGPQPPAYANRRAHGHQPAHRRSRVDGGGGRLRAVEQVRRRRQEAFKSREGFSLTYLPFIARATVDALNAFPSSTRPSTRRRRSRSSTVRSTWGSPSTWTNAG